MRTLLIDIETAPNVVYSWGLFNVNISLAQLIQPSYTLCFAAKWAGEKKIMFHKVDQTAQSNAVMVQAAWDLLNEADAVVHYNGKHFDIPILNREFISAGLTPPAPYKQIDLYQTVRNKFKFASNKLEHILKQLELTEKVKHEGFSLWEKVMAGDTKAWKDMEKYCKGDISPGLEDLYNLLIPWLTSHPNRLLYDEDATCPRCISGDIVREGYSWTNAGKYQRYSCRNCGGWFRGNKRITAVDIQEMVL